MYIEKCHIIQLKNIYGTENVKSIKSQMSVEKWGNLDHRKWRNLPLKVVKSCHEVLFWRRKR